jgi:hypothetical protein
MVQAQEASEETLKQGRSIMLFTVITIVFVSYNPYLSCQGEAKADQIPSSIATSFVCCKCLQHEFYRDRFSKRAHDLRRSIHLHV